jgi:serine protease inhibitor
MGVNLMKKIFSYVVCILIITGFSACSNRASSLNNTAVKSPVYPKSISFDDYDSQYDIRTKNQLDENYKRALDDFSYASASKLLGGKTKNTSYSPTSLYMALSIAGIGAKGTTQDEILSILGMSGKGIDYVSEQNSKLFKLLYSDNEIGKLKIANSLWLQKGIDFKTPFMDTAVESFYASLYNVDFADNSSSLLMSKWVSENTNGVLTPKITLHKEQIMSILNTIYYKDEWIDRFDKTKTKPDTFYLSDGNRLQCDFMNRTYVTHRFTRGDGFTASSLNLKNGGSMLFVLPDKEVTVESLLSTPEKVAALFENQNSISGKVIFQIPKFSYGSSLELNDTLSSMGVKTAFRKNADFSGITDGIAFISNIKQQTHVAIDEKGVEAAAFTKLDYAVSAPPKDEVAEMILNRPFIYAIKSYDRLLFIGIVTNPAEK